MMASQVPNSTANQDVHALTQKFSGILPITPFKPKLQRCALDPKIRTQYSKNLVFFYNSVIQFLKMIHFP